MTNESEAMSYDASKYLSSGIEAWADGPNVPDAWLYMKASQYGEWYEGWPQMVERATADGTVELFPLDELTVGFCLRCQQSIHVPARLWDGQYDHDEFCQLCWLKMRTNATLRGMRAMLLDLGADPVKVDEMWLLGGAKGQVPQQD